jgi:uncharacterized membrane protein SirB2
MYLALKHLHITCVILSIGGFFVRGLLSFSGSAPTGRSWLRWLPHVNDTILLAAAIGLALVLGQYPFVHAWLTAKVFGLIAYIILGSIALKAGRTRGLRLVAWLAALLVFGYVASVALTKNPLGALAWLGT